MTKKIERFVGVRQLSRFPPSDLAEPNETVAVVAAVDDPVKISRFYF
jgi:hypothetical protein